MDNDISVLRPELDELDLPQWLPGDQLKYAGRGVHFYDPAGDPIPGSVVEQVQAWGAYKIDPDNYRRERFTGTWGSFDVSTAYLGNNTALIFLGPPEQSLIEIYETMIFGGEDCYTVARYGSRTAAWYGHAVVLDLLIRALPGVPHMPVEPPGLRALLDGEIEW